jgi:hypothetical protein
LPHATGEHGTSPKARKTGTDREGNAFIVEDTSPNKKVLALHKDLRKAESTILVQARTKKIGLAKFIHTLRVLGVTTAQCSCNIGEETARHIAVYYSREHNRRQLLRTNRQISYHKLVGSNERAKNFTEWLIHSGRLGQFSLARRLLYN